MTAVSMLIAVSFALALGAVILFALRFLSASVPSDGTKSQSEGSAAGRSYRAVIACAGPSATGRIHRYVGLADCRIVHRLYAGDLSCKDACLGYGTCRAVCPLNAIEQRPDGLPVVLGRCDGCGKCVAECPTGAIRLVPRDADYFVRCSSRSEPDQRLSFCSSACTACGDCARLAGHSGFSVSGGLAAIDYRARGTDRSHAASCCPTGCIAPLSLEEIDKNAFQGTDNRLECSERESGAADAGK